MTSPEAATMRAVADQAAAQTLARVGRVLEWPGGFSMTLGVRLVGGGVVRCCSGHTTPEEAKNHGLVRLIEVATAAADRDLTQWAEEHKGMSCHDDGEGMCHHGTCDECAS